MANHKRILSHIPKMLTDYESWKAPFRVQIRPSSLPFCQVQYLFAELDPMDVSVGDSFMERIFISLGSTTHDLVQTYLGRAGILYGKWKCKKCYYTSSPTLGSPYCGEKRLEWERGTDKDDLSIGPEKSPCNSGYATKYVEFALIDPISGLIGKCDGIILMAGHLYLLEVKTKATSAIVSALKVPDPPHISQATTYAEMATPKEWGLDQEIEGIAFCYIPRDYPNRMKIIFHPRDATELQNVRKDVPEVGEMMEKGNVQDARAVCPDEHYAKKVKYCEYSGQCFRPDRGKYLRKLWKQRQIEQKRAEEMS